MTATETRRTRTSPTALADEFRVFCRQPSPRIEAAALGTALVARLLAGSGTVSDAVVVAVILGAQPFTEWVIHVFVLHYRPVTLFGRTIDFELARRHRLHHADPTDVALVFVPRRFLAKALPIGAVLMLVLLPTVGTALTAMATAAAMLLAYEWTHYLIHSSYRPRTRVFRYLQRAHRLHHYKNERYWFGVTNPAADHVLRTFPDPAEVETSPTARSLTGRPPT